MSELTINTDERGEWRWRLVARDGAVISESTQGHGRRLDCIYDILKVCQELTEHCDSQSLWVYW